MRSLLAVVVCAGCGDNCIDFALSIEQGVYGLVTYRSDVGGSERYPVGDREVSVREASGPIVATTRSNANGVFQVELPESDFALCSEGYCVKFQIERGELERVDYLTGFGSRFQLVTAGVCED